MSIGVMTKILELMLVVVCIVTTAFPVWYGLFSTWWTTMAGRSMLAMSAGLATAWDVTAFLHFWPPDTVESLEVYFWLQFTVMLITIAAGLYVLYALGYNRAHGKMVAIRYTTQEQEDHIHDEHP